MLKTENIQETENSAFLSDEDMEKCVWWDRYQWIIQGSKFELTVR